MIDRDPIGAGEPFVGFDIVDAVLQISVTFRQIDLEKITEKIFQITAEVRRKANLQTNENRLDSTRRVRYFARDDLFVDLNRLIGEERWITLRNEHRHGFERSASSLTADIS